MSVEQRNSPYYEMEPLRRSYDVEGNSADSETKSSNDDTDLVIVTIDNLDCRQRNSNADDPSDAIELRSSSPSCEFLETVSNFYGLSTERTHERNYVTGQWIWSIFCLSYLFTTLYGEDYLLMLYSGNAFILLLLWLHNLLRCNFQHQQPIAATYLIPILLFTIFDLDLFKQLEIPMAICTPIVLLVIIVGSRIFPGRFPEIFRSTASKKSVRMLVLGEWIFLALFLAIAAEYWEPGDWYFITYVLNNNYYTLLPIVAGILLFSLWCMKQSCDDIEACQKELFISELIPFLIFFCPHLIIPLIGTLMISILVLPITLWFLIVRRLTNGSNRVTRGITQNFCGAVLRRMEDAYFDNLRDIEEQEGQDLRAQQDRLAYLEGESKNTDLFNKPRLKIIAGLAALSIASVIYLSWHISETTYLGPLEKWTDG